MLDIFKKLTIISSVSILFSATFVFASTGTIDDTYKYGWGENLGWINFKPNAVGLTITDSVVTGYVWSSNAGWINFSPAVGGVTNTTLGVLGGSAWSTNMGWISMSGITINSSGKFIGTAGTLGSTAGRITFSCANCDVRTSWRPATDSVGGGSVGSGVGSGLFPLVPPAKDIETTKKVIDLSSPEYLKWLTKDVKSADIVKDGEINIFDFNNLMISWNKKGKNIFSDINGDGSVDLFDFNLLMVYWNKKFI